MRGKQARVLTTMEGLGEEVEEGEGPEEEDDAEELAMPELQHNVRLLVEMAEADIRRLDVALREEQDSAVRGKGAIGGVGAR